MNKDGKAQAGKVEYPRTVYTLTRNYNIRKVTLVRPYSEYSYGDGYTKGGQLYRNRDIYATKAKAIRAGRAWLRRRQKALEAGLELVAQHIAALDKAEADKPTAKRAVATKDGAA